MILLDVNLLIYAVNSASPVHPKAKRWLENVLAGPETVAFSSLGLLAFIRLTTRAGLFERPLPIAIAFDLIEHWLRQPSAIILEPGPRHWQIMRSLLLPVGAGGNLSSDAHLAAMAIEYGCVLCSRDRDFDRFPGLKYRNPLAG